MPLGRIATPLPPDRVVGPDDPASGLLAHGPVAGDLIAVVAADHHVVGTVTTGDVERLLQRDRLRKVPAHTT
ncbi:hypothetical protein [Actinomadura litoris]|uniref:CBS domain-containing protein n=1 Tax=Actinomadura litoris TaxID=2678616 RepID=A0A7K1L5H8_9ACTN|nr:hypothetical protein [Actinomadura litoris]MUN39649.1 hypothetical protein [Actinomadura litoris]